ncbi:SRPBCC family protein [Herbaspirillum sp. RV1423]|uniref:SRPBCC family protein n=1 Tax=Herbaspirillum sp. RV1423 TaxID=1443993 RepID=UPI0004B24F42|nr:SRPBCC family protein [Herbaspirillum sp. RV1423]
MPILERATIIPNCTPEEVFEFCLDGANFPKIFPEPVRPVAKLDIADLRIEQGREFRFWHWMFWCIPARWRVRIVEVRPNRHFIDEMLDGPLKSFRHQHIVAAAPGGTLYTDRVAYSAIGGRLVEKLFVDRYMARIFDARHRNMLALLKKPQ